MSEFYESGTQTTKVDESACTRCLRSSPLAALLLMILVFLGGTAFGIGTIFARKTFYELLDVDHLFPYMDYTVYGIVGGTGLFAIIVYIICTISSGWNAKRCFDGSRATSCGRCMNCTLLICLVIAVLFWALVACLLTYPVMSGALLLYRDAGPSRSITSEESLIRTSRQIGEGFDEASETRPPGVIGLNVNPSKVIADYFTCDPTKVDLSYYGLYDIKGKPLMLDSANLNSELRNPLIFISVAFLGAIIILLAYVLLTCAAAMNYARLKELRYYEPSVNDDETIRLRH